MIVFLVFDSFHKSLVIIMPKIKLCFSVVAVKTIMVILLLNELHVMLCTHQRLSLTIIFIRGV